MTEAGVWFQLAVALNRLTDTINASSVRGIPRVLLSLAGLHPSSQGLLEASPQFICPSLRILTEMLFDLALHLVPRALQLKLIHAQLDIGEAAIVRLTSSSGLTALAAQSCGLADD
jgi:hypothetical protein